MLDYSAYVQDALRKVVKRCLEDAKENHLSVDPKGRHFVIDFVTNHPDVNIPGFLASRYPHEMRVIMQYAYERLEITEQGFSVDLMFDGEWWNLKVPFKALVFFGDPITDFSLNFEPDYGDDEENPMRVFGRKAQSYMEGNVVDFKAFKEGKERNTSVDLY